MFVTAKPQVRLDVDIQVFEERYNREYQFLYDNHDRVAGYAEALAEAEYFFSKHGDFVGEFARYRGDYLTSDRELVAFILTLNDMLSEMGGESYVDIHGAQH